MLYGVILYQYVCLWPVTVVQLYTYVGIITLCITDVEYQGCTGFWLQQAQNPAVHGNPVKSGSGQNFSGICQMIVQLQCNQSVTDKAKPDRQWRSSSFQESKKVRVSRDLWPWPWPWAYHGCRLTGDHRVQVWSRSGHLPERRSDLRKSLQTDGQTNRQTTDASPLYKLILRMTQKRS